MSNEIDRPDGVLNASEAVDATLHTIEERKKRVESGTALANMWGIPEMDGLINPYWAGDTVYVEAYLSNGKSFIARMKAYNALKILMENNMNEAVVWITPEESVEKVTAHFLSKMSGISASSIISGRISDVEMHRMSTYVAEVTTWPLFIIGNSIAQRDSGGKKQKPVRLTMAQIEDGLDFIMNKLNVDIALLILDYFQKVAFPEDYAGNMEPHMRNVVDWNRSMAKWAGAPFVICAQSNRQVLEKKLAIPGMNDIEWTNRAGEDADFIFGSLFPKTTLGVGSVIEDVTLFNGSLTRLTVTHRHMFIKVAKQRDGRAGDIFLLEAYPELLQWKLYKPEEVDFNNGETFERFLAEQHEKEARQAHMNF